MGYDYYFHLVLVKAPKEIEEKNQLAWKENEDGLSQGRQEPPIETYAKEIAHVAQQMAEDDKTYVYPQLAKLIMVLEVTHADLARAISKIMHKNWEQNFLEVFLPYTILPGIVVNYMFTLSLIKV